MEIHRGPGLAEIRARDRLAVVVLSVLSLSQKETLRVLGC